MADTTKTIPAPIISGDTLPAAATVCASGHNFQPVGNAWLSNRTGDRCQFVYCTRCGSQAVVTVQAISPR